MGYGSSMKGLTKFIADLRHARVQELEEKRINHELANIRKKFKEPNLSGYQKRKYVCKLLYIYVLGYDVDFGHFEAFNLVTSPKINEKQIGYLAVTLLLHENHPLINLVINSMKKDLQDSNEWVNCFALHAISAIGGEAMVESVAPDVEKLLLAPTSDDFARKKAALTMLRLFRKAPERIDQAWAERLCALVDHPHSGVALSVTSLINELARARPTSYISVYPTAVQRLRSLLEYGAIPDYTYYGIAEPWLQVKLLKLLQCFPPTQEPVISKSLHQIFELIIAQSQSIQDSIQQANATHAILFEGINLAIHIGADASILSHVMDILVKHIGSRETNIRYLGLETLSRLVLKFGPSESLFSKRHLIIANLKDKDVSLRLKALDLLYNICNESTAQWTVETLLSNLSRMDGTIRNEMVLKISMLAETFATESTWYIDVCLRLINAAGDHVPHKVWSRVIQIVTNNEDTQAYAAREIAKCMKKKDAHEDVVRIGAFILGEFGHYIANEKEFCPVELFALLRSRYASVSESTQNMILSTYLKFVNIFPELKDIIEDELELYTKISNIEAQQRACEYLTLIRSYIDDVLQAVCEEMPPFQTIKKLDKFKISQEYIISSNGNGEKTESLKIFPILPSSGWEAGFNKLVCRNSDIFYEDDLIRIDYQSNFDPPTGRVAMRFTNILRTVYTSFTIALMLPNNETEKSLSVAITKVPASELVDTQSTLAILDFEAQRVFENAPMICITWLAGSLQQLNLVLPVVIHKFMIGVELSNDEWVARWDNLTKHTNLIWHNIFRPLSGRRGSIERSVSVLETFNFTVCSNTEIIRGSGIFRCSSCNIGVLCSLQCTTDEFDLTVCATNALIPPNLGPLMQKRLAIGVRSAL